MQKPASTNNDPTITPETLRQDSSIDVVTASVLSGAIDPVTHHIYPVNNSQNKENNIITTMSALDGTALSIRTINVAAETGAFQFPPGTDRNDNQSVIKGAGNAADANAIAIGFPFKSRGPPKPTTAGNILPRPTPNQGARDSLKVPKKPKPSEPVPTPQPSNSQPPAKRK